MFTDSFNILCVDATTFTVDGCFDFQSEMLLLGVHRSEWTQKLIRNLSPQSLCCLAEVNYCLFLVRLFLLLKRNLIIIFYLTAKMTLSEPPVAFNLNRLGPYCATKKKESLFEEICFYTFFNLIILQAIHHHIS